MNALQGFVRLACSLSVLAVAAGCAHVSDCERNAAVGAVVGGVAGSVMTDGSTAGTVGGAVAGGVIGNRSGRNPC